MRKTVRSTRTGEVSPAAAEPAAAQRTTAAAARPTGGRARQPRTRWTAYPNTNTALDATCPQIAAERNHGAVPTWIRYPLTAMTAKPSRDTQPLRRCFGSETATFLAAWERNTMPKLAIRNGAATTWAASIAGCQAWFTSANGSSVSSSHFITK